MRKYIHTWNTYLPVVKPMVFQVCMVFRTWKSGLRLFLIGQKMNGRRLFPVPNVCRNFVGMPNNFLDEYISYLLLTFLRFLRQ